LIWTPNSLARSRHLQSGKGSKSVALVQARRFVAKTRCYAHGGGGTRDTPSRKNLTRSPAGNEASLVTIVLCEWKRKEIGIAGAARISGVRRLQRDSDASASVTKRGSAFSGILSMPSAGVILPIAPRRSNASPCRSGGRLFLRRFKCTHFASQASPSRADGSWEVNRNFVLQVLCAPLSRAGTAFSAAIFIRAIGRFDHQQSHARTLPLTG
jgi:hypothetical protein